ncbi:MAG: dTMP kinase [Bacteroidota bacterium]
MLITFEGIDGSGKSTQIQILKDKLEALSIEVSVFREPGGTDLSEMVRGMLLNPEIEIDSVTELLLFSSARSQLVAEKVIPRLKENQVVILDRFYDSTVAYQGYGRESVPIQDIKEINHIAAHGLIPDITFYIRLSQQESARRTLHLQKDRMERAGDSFFNRVIEGFEALAESESRIYPMDGTLTSEQLHDQIWGVLEPVLPGT